LIINYFFIDWIDLNKAPHFDPRVSVLDVLLWLVFGIFQVFIGISIFYGNLLQAGLLTGGYHVLASFFRNKRLTHDIGDASEKPQEKTTGSLSKSINYTWTTRLFSLFVLAGFIGLKIFCHEIDQGGKTIWYVGSIEMTEFGIWKCFSYTLILSWIVFSLLKIERSHNYIFRRYVESLKEIEENYRNRKEEEKKQSYDYMFKRYSSYLKKKENKQN
jgi:hypothetical protein